MSPKISLLLGALLAIGSVMIFPLTSATNCGGNSAALAAVNSYVVLARVGAIDSPDHVFRVASLTQEQRAQLDQITNKTWLRGAHFLVSKAPILTDSTERRIVIVCDTPYNNVPQRRFGSAPFSHAAGFANGSTGLISPAEFAALNRSSFVALDQLDRADSN